MASSYYLDCTLAALSRPSEPLFSQVGIRAGKPVRARRAEHVHVEGVFQGFGAMGNIWRDHQHLASPHRNFLAGQNKLQRAFQNVRNLLIFMVMHGNQTAFSQEQPGQHTFFRGDVLPLEQWIEMFDGHCVKAEMLYLWSVNVRH